MYADADHDADAEVAELTWSVSEDEATGVLDGGRLNSTFNKKSRGFLEALAVRGLKPKEPNAAERRCLDDVQFTTRPDGKLNVYNDSGNVGTIVDPGRGVCIPKHGPGLQTTEGIATVLQSQVLLKSMLPDDSLKTWIAGSEMGQMMGFKAAELAGTAHRIENPPATRLDDVDPELARRMEEEWSRMQLRHGDPQPTPETAPVPTYTRAASPGF